MAGSNAVKRWPPPPPAKSREEVGLRVDAQTLAFLGVSRYDLGGVRGTDFLFLGREWSGEPVPLEQTSEVGWFAPTELPADSLPWLAGVLAAHLLGDEVLTEQLETAWKVCRACPAGGNDSRLIVLLPDEIIPFEMNDSPSLPTSPPDEVYALVRAVLRLSRRFHQVLDDPLEHSLGLNTKELVVLAAIMDGADTPSAVAERQRLPAPTVTRMVTKLAGLGLLERVSDPVRPAPPTSAPDR